MYKQEHSWTSNVIELQEFQKGYKQSKRSEIHTTLKKNKGSNMNQVKTRLKLTLDFLNDIKIAYKNAGDNEIQEIYRATEEIENFLLIHDLKYDK